MDDQAWRWALLAATCLHAGFQVTITTLVYPALARLPGDAWSREHDLHSRRIVPLVGLAYAAVLITTAGALLTDSSPLVALSAVGSAVTLGTTALRAAPLHGRLGSGHDPSLVRSLLVADRVLAVGAVVAALAA
ncbi:MAG: hypothetical protein JWR20_2780, partial [Marmoricola sp.]|nr:hypothetical protein [Marmoricola sp.]